MTDYILPGFIIWIITSCLEPLHAPIHAPIHAPESIICSRIHYNDYIHYMLPNPLHAASVHRCQSMGSGPGHQQRRSDRCVARLARLERAVNSPSSVGFNLQDNIPACIDRTCSIQMKCLPARGPCTIEVEQCRWWLGQVVRGISRMLLLNIHAILPRIKI
jgi:hypothetical protein